MALLVGTSTVRGPEPLMGNRAPQFCSRKRQNILNAWVQWRNPESKPDRRSLTSTRDRNRLNLSSSLKISPMVLEENLMLQKRTSTLVGVAVGAVYHQI